MNEINTKIKRVYIESDKGQSGNAIIKVWKAPFDFNIMVEYAKDSDYYGDWDDFYNFKCKVTNENDDIDNIKFRGQNKRCPNPCRMRVMRGQSRNVACFECRVTAPGHYTVDVNGVKTNFDVVK